MKRKLERDERGHTRLILSQTRAWLPSRHEKFRQHGHLCVMGG